MVDTVKMPAVPAPTQSSGGSGTKKKKVSKIDRSAGPIRTIGICALFTGSLLYAVVNQPSETNGVMKFNRGTFLDLSVSPPFFLGMPAFYLILVWTLSRWMRTREPTDWFKRNVQPAYNLAQIVLCGAMTWGLMPRSITNVFGINTERDANVEFWVWVHFLSKYLDFCDTFFMIARKSYRQISFLQVFHHATISIVWPFLLNRGWGSGTASYGAWINSVTHVIMYTHYLLASLGIDNPFKAYITKFQLSQFASCIVHALVVLRYETVFPEALVYMQVAYHPIMLYLFGFQMMWAPQWCTGPSEDDEETAQLKKKTT